MQAAFFLCEREATFFSFLKNISISPSQPLWLSCGFHYQHHLTYEAIFFNKKQFLCRDIGIMNIARSFEFSGSVRQLFFVLKRVGYPNFCNIQSIFTTILG